MAITGLPIGKISVVIGSASVRSVDGTVRRLAPGDPVFEGDVLLTADASKVDIAFHAGGSYTLGGRETLTLDAQVFAADAVQVSDNALLPTSGELGAVTHAILTGTGSLDGLFEAPAAGVAGAGGDDNGSTFVALLRISESTTPVENGPTSIQTQSRTQYAALGAGAQADTEAAPEAPPVPPEAPPAVPPEAPPQAPGSISVTLPATIMPGSGATAVGISGSTTAVAGGSSITLLVKDSDSATADRTYTTVTGADGSFSIVADLSGMARGALTVTASAVDQRGSAVTGSSSATMLNAAPASNPDALAALEDTALTIGRATLLGNDRDADADPLVISSVQAAVNGKVTIIGANVLFTPDANFHGPASFTYTITDGHGASSTSTVSLDIVAVADAALITPASATLSETDTPVSVSGTMQITDVDSPATFVPRLVAGNYGSLTIDAAGAWHYLASSAHDPFAAGTAYSDTFSVTSADGTASTITVNILGTNDAAIVSTATIDLVETNAALHASGTLTISDVDSPATFTPNTIAGLFGTLAIDATGNWHYSAHAAHDQFQAGATYTDVFTVVSHDGTTSTVTVRIAGTDDAAVLSRATVELIESDIALSATGALSVSDPDSPAAFIAGTIAGAYGSLTIDASGAWTYTASAAHDAFKAGITYADVFTVASTDGGASTVTVRIAGTNDAAVLGTAVVNLIETDAVLKASGSLSISDIDSDANFQPATINGAYGSLSINAAGAWQYTASAAHDAFVADAWYTDVFTVASADGTISHVTINILGTDDAAVISAGVANLVETDAPLTALGTLTILDADNSATFNAATISGTYGNLTIDAAGAWTYLASSAHNAFRGGVAYNESFTVSTTQGATTSVTINITGTNDAPMAKNDANAITEDAASANLTVSAANGLIQSTAALAGRDLDAESDPLIITALRTGAASSGSTGTAGTIGMPLTGAYGVLVVNADGSYTYELRNFSTEVQALAAGETALDAFTYTVGDGNGGFSSATLTITITGTLDLTAGAPIISALPNAANGLTGAYYGYNDTATAAGRTHSDDGQASFGNHLAAGNLNAVEDLAFIIDGRNALAGGAGIVGTANSATASSADVTFLARSLSYGVAPPVNNALGANSDVAAGGSLASVNSGSSLATFLYHDKATSAVQTGAGNTNGTSGLGSTSDAAVRVSGQFYVQPGVYDFRVHADDGFRLNVAGKTLIEFDGNQQATTRVFKNVELSNLEGRLQDLELLYWEQGGNAVLKIEYKASNDPHAAYQTMSLTNTALFSAETAPTLSDPHIQDLVYDTTSASWQLRTGSRLDGDDDRNTLTGNVGRDVLSGAGGNDTLIGNAGADRLDGGLGDDTLYGGTGNDVLIGGAGEDRLEGGLGDDLYILSDTLDTLIESTGAGSDTVQLAPNFTGTGYTLANRVENLTATGTAAFTLTGNALDNRIEGNNGNNRIEGLAGNDYLAGGGGNDLLIGGAGADVFAWKLGDQGLSGAPASDRITDFNYGGGFSTVESATPGVAVGGGDVLDLRDLLVGERTSSGTTNQATGLVEISNLQNFIHVEIKGASTVLHINNTGGFSSASNTGEHQTITLNNVNLYTATGIAAGDDANLLKMLIKMGTLRVD